MELGEGKRGVWEVGGRVKEVKEEGKMRGMGGCNLRFRQLEEFKGEGYLEVFEWEY